MNFAGISCFDFSYIEINTIFKVWARLSAFILRNLLFSSFSDTVISCIISNESNLFDMPPLINKFKLLSNNSSSIFSPSFYKIMLLNTRQIILHAQPNSHLMYL